MYQYKSKQELRQVTVSEIKGPYFKIFTPITPSPPNIPLILHLKEDKEYREYLKTPLWVKPYNSRSGT